jgi:hypothetical protein
MRGEDYSNHFMLVRNLARAVQPFVDRMDWLDIHRSLFCPKKKEKSLLGLESSGRTNSTIRDSVVA